MLELQDPHKNGISATRLPPAVALPQSTDWHPKLHLWIVLTFAVTVVAEITGSLVTTLNVGMADRDWPTWPWQLLTRPWSAESFDYLVEHTHRLADYLTGILVIVLTVGACMVARRRWVRWLGVAALPAVILQGVLGGLRIKLEIYFGQAIGTDLRIIHGSAAHLFLALLGVLVLVTSRGWTMSGFAMETSKRLRIVAVLLASMVYLQIIFGAILRHTDYSPLAQRGHLLVVMLVVALSTMFMVVARSEKVLTGGSKKVLYAFKGLLVLQIMIGVETWLKRFHAGLFDSQPDMTLGTNILRSLHLVIGSLLFATAVMLAVCMYRCAIEESSIDRKGALEGVA
jgi:cytochrome c oxidase assembly protein subunit 15